MVGVARRFLFALVGVLAGGALAAAAAEPAQTNKSEPGRTIQGSAPRTLAPTPPSQKTPREQTQPVQRTPEAAEPTVKTLQPQRVIQPKGKKPGAPAPAARPPSDAALPQNRGSDFNKTCDDHFGVDSVQMSPPLDPGEDIFILGCGFGLNPPGGHLRLSGDFPGGYLDLEIVGWLTARIHGRVPRVTGVQDVPDAKLQVVRWDGQSSGWVDVGGFRAAREERWLTRDDVTVVCGFRETLHHQGGYCRPDLGDTNSYFADSTVAVQQRHWIGAGPDGELRINARHETDSIAVQLANGWTLGGHVFHYQVTEGSGCVQFKPLTGVIAGSSSATVGIEWGFSIGASGDGNSSSCMFRYRVRLWAEGPKGVPHK